MKNTLFNRAFAGFNFEEDNHVRQCKIITNDYNEKVKGYIDDYNELVNKIDNEYNKIRMSIIANNIFI